MNRVLLVVNGAQYSMEAIKKAVWMVNNEDAQLEVLYVNPPCNQMYPDVPGLCFWMPEWEYKNITDRLRSKVLDEKIIPIFRNANLDPRIIVTNRDQDEKIKEMSEEYHYDKILIASPSKYCQPEEKGWLWFKGKPNNVPSGTVCLI